jgi:hypothetical protein
VDAVREASNTNLFIIKRLDRGGLFTAWEQPGLFSEELRDSFRSLRKTHD